MKLGLALIESMIDPVSTLAGKANYTLFTGDQNVEYINDINWEMKAIVNSFIALHFPTKA